MRFFLPVSFLSLLLVFSLFPGLLTPYVYDAPNASNLLTSPSLNHAMGTDELGRDLLSRVLFGARVSLACALLSTLLSALFGTLIGAAAGYRGGWLDHAFMRMADLLYAIPDLLFFILIGLFLGRSFTGLLVSLSLLGWIPIARLIRAEILKVKQTPLVEGQRALGSGTLRLLFRHLLPQTFPVLTIALLQRIPAVILAESTLSFIGLGLKPPYASWGTLASEGYSAMLFYPHLIFFPSLFMVLTVLSFYSLARRGK